MSTRRAAMLVMAKMALSDGTVSVEERMFLEPLLGEGESLESLLEEAKQRRLVELIEPIDSYADRFFIALRAASMAAIDAQLDSREEALYDRLITVLEITGDDQALIQESVDGLNAEEPPPVDPRIEELFQQSSFSS